MGGEQRTPWGVCSNGAGELGQQEVLDVPCGWHPLPQNPWPSTLFLSHNQPPTKQGPLIHVCYGFLSPRWQVNGSFVFWAQNESPSSARSKSEGRGDETWMLLGDAKEKQTGQRHMLQGEQTLPSDLNQKKKKSQSFGTRTVPVTSMQQLAWTAAAHTALTSHVSSPHFWHWPSRISSATLAKLCQNWQKEKVTKERMHPKFWKTLSQ